MNSHEYRLNTKNGEIYSDISQYEEETWFWGNAPAPEAIGEQYEALPIINIPPGKYVETKRKMRFIYGPPPSTSGTYGTSGVDGYYRTFTDKDWGRRVPTGEYILHFKHHLNQTNTMVEVWNTENSIPIYTPPSSITRIDNNTISITNKTAFSGTITIST